MQPWPERDNALLSEDKWVILNWSNSQTPAIVWPGCDTRFWILVNFAISLLPTATQDEREAAQKFMKARGCKVLDRQRVDTLFGVLSLNALLRLA